jgi:hypothetical protein
MESFNKAIELTKANKGEEAWNAGKALGAKYPKSVDVQRMLCRLSYVKAAGDEGLAACARAHELLPCRARAADRRRPGPHPAQGDPRGRGRHRRRRRAGRQEARPRSTSGSGSPSSTASSAP